MGRRLKQGKAGNAVQYLTRNQALKKLQVRLSEFRRLCILKGIHPREPKKKTKGQNKTYYHVKDILFLAHEPLLQKYREAAVHTRKIRKARAKRNDDLARRLLARTPSYRLDHLVKERYPSFMDALRDLDDALTLVHLFATLPAEQRHRIPTTAVQTSRRLALEWQAYIVRTSSLRKVFASVKGFYYQAEIMGQPVTWLVPHQLSQVLPRDVDYRVMLTFLEFYQTLLQFVNFKLYHMLGVRYPPVVDPRMEQAAAGLAAIMEDLAHPPESTPALPPASGADEALDAEASRRLEGLQHKLREIQEQGTEAVAAAEPSEAAAVAPAAHEDEGEEQQEIDSGSESDEEAAAHTALEAKDDAEQSRRASHAEAGGLVPADASSFEEARALVGGAAEDDAEVCATLFRGMVFFLGREVPREQLLVVIRSFGGMVGWTGEESPILDTDERITHQVVDRPNVGERLPGREYVQPQWVLDSANFRVLVDARLYTPGLTPPPHLSPFVDDDEEGYVPEYARALQKLQESARSVRQRMQGIDQDAAFLEVKSTPAAEDDAAAAERLYKAELTRELGEKRKATGEPAVEEDGSDEEAVGRGTTKAAATEAQLAEADDVAMKKAVMKRKDRNLYQSILNSQKAKRQKISKLEQKRASLAAEAE